MSDRVATGRDVPAGALRPATYAKYYEQAADKIDAQGNRHWITRSGNLIVVLTSADGRAVLERADNPDESMLLLPPGVNARIEAKGETLEARADSLTILPPGPSRVTTNAPGSVVRIFSTKAADLLVQASNASTYADGAPEVAPVVPWPEPVGGFRLRHYPLADYASPDPSPLKMRVFRSTNMMINLFLPWPAPRDESKLSPHAHDDFEQISLALEGTFVHHLRYPWTANKTKWRNDEHEVFGSPSVLVIPARVEHTSQNIGEGVARLVDIFAPPRFDFSRRPGFVLNAADYPMPD